VFVSKYEAVFRCIGLFRRTIMVEAVHNFVKSGHFITEQLYYIFTTLKHSLDSCYLKITAVWKQL